LVRHILHLPGKSARLNAMKPLASELKVIALHVNRPTSITHDVEAIIYAANEIVE
jgi:hypothetical protein